MEAAQRDDDSRQDSVGPEARRTEVVAPTSGREGSRAEIVERAATRGTAMHKILEKYIIEQGYLDLTENGLEAHHMAKKSY